jgi:tRNA pseudouridine55 synthase
LYELARKGKTVEREERAVMINRIAVTRHSPDIPSFTMEVECSKGTYIRSLCADIGEKLGCGACMGELVRTRSGIFGVRDSVRLGELKRIVTEQALHQYLIPVERALPFPRLPVNNEDARRARNGNTILWEDAGAAQKYWVCEGDTIIGLFAPKPMESFTCLAPEVMLYAPG